MIYNLLEKDHPMVHMRMKEENQPEDKVEFAKDMAESMKSWGGIGLSANQVGFPYRMFVMGDANNYMSCYNPKIIVEYNSVEIELFTHDKNNSVTEKDYNLADAIDKLS